MAKVLAVQDDIDTLVRADIDYVWHPWTQMKHYVEAGPIIVTGGKGCTLTDSNGKKYLDTVSGLWNVNLGYGRQELIDSASEQIGNLAYVNLSNFSHPAVIELARRLAAALPGTLSRTFFCNSGSEANETALKIARQYHLQSGAPRKYKFLSFRRGYHGNSLGALSITGTKRDRLKVEPLLPGTVQAPIPVGLSQPADAYAATCDAAFDELGQIIEHEGADSIAALFIEQIQGVGGVHVPTQSYLKRIEQLCRANDILLIADEVVTGFGRTGNLFALDHFGIVPDMVTMAKGITSGYLPLGATVVQEKIFEKFWSDDRTMALVHGFTSGGNPVACAVAIAVLDVIEKDRLAERAARMGQLLQDRLREVKDRTRVISDVRGLGLMVGLEFCDSDDPAQPAPLPFMQKLTRATIRRGVIVRTLGSFGHIVPILPPLCITEAEVNTVAGVIEEAIKEARR
jgi:taurine-pyruvate aminotransferase